MIRIHMSTDNLYQRVIDVYRRTVSVKKTAETVGTTLVRAQRILITEGLIYHTTTMPVEVYIAMSDQQAEEEHGYRCIENAILDSYRSYLAG